MSTLIAISLSTVYLREQVTWMVVTSRHPLGKVMGSDPVLAVEIYKNSGDSDRDREEQDTDLYSSHKYLTVHPGYEPGESTRCFVMPPQKIPVKKQGPKTFGAERPNNCMRDWVDVVVVH